MWDIIESEAWAVRRWAEEYIRAKKHASYMVYLNDADSLACACMFSSVVLLHRLCGRGIEAMLVSSQHHGAIEVDGLIIDITATQADNSFKPVEIRTVESFQEHFLQTSRGDLAQWWDFSHSFTSVDMVFDVYRSDRDEGWCDTQFWRKYRDLQKTLKHADKWIEQYCTK